MMYNEELKRRYIKEKQESVCMPYLYLENRFKEVASKEMELQKDVSQFTTNEILEYYKIGNHTSFSVLNVLNSQFSMYTQWCFQQNLLPDNQNHFLEITSELISSCLNKRLQQAKIITKNELLECIKELPNPRDQFIILALFEIGKNNSFLNIIYAKTNDFNFSDKKLKLYSGEEVEVSRELISYANDAATETKYYSVSDQKKKTMTLIDEGYIVKNYPNIDLYVSDFQKGRRLYSSIVRSLNFMGLGHLTPNDIVESGKIHYIKSKAKEYECSIEEYLNEITYRQELINQYQLNSFSKARFMAKNGDFF